MESKNDVLVFVIPMCLGLNYDFSVLLNPRNITNLYSEVVERLLVRTQRIQPQKPIILTNS